MKTLFQTKVPIPTNGKELDNIECIALSFGMSLTPVPIADLILYYTPWGIRLAPITLSLLTLTLIFATTAVLREHKKRTTKMATNEKIALSRW